MRISDWSSDVCSSDLKLAFHRTASIIKMVSSETLFSDPDDLCREPIDLGAVVADVEDRQFEFVANPFDHRHDIAAPRRVERRERLVHPQDFGTREQRAADRAALRLPA